MPFISTDVDADLIEEIRTLKGAPLGVFVLLTMTKEPVSQMWLECKSGYTDKPVRAALMYLKEIGWVVKTPKGWRLSDGMLLCFGQSPQKDREPGEENGLARNNSDSAGDMEESGDLLARNNSDPGENLVGGVEKLMRKYSDSSKQLAPRARFDIHNRQSSWKNSGPVRNFSGIGPNSSIIISIKDLLELKDLKVLKDLNNNNSINSSCYLEMNFNKNP